MNGKTEDIETVQSTVLYDIPIRHTNKRVAGGWKRTIKR